MSLEQLEGWYKRIGRRFIQLAIVVVLVYIFFKYIVELVLPFLIAWLLASLLNPFVTWMQRKAKIPRGLGTLFSMVTILSLLITGITFIVKQIWYQIEALSLNFDSYKNEIMKVLPSIEERLQQLSRELPLPADFNSLDELINKALTVISGYLNGFVSGVTSIVGQLPNAFFFMIVILISVFFMTKDNRMIRDFIKAQIPDHIIMKCVIIQKGLKDALGGYIKTQLILMCFTFSICLFGLVLLKRDYALLIAFCIAVFDALPVFGSGAILIPWAIFQMVIGNYVVGAGLLGIYGTIVVVRQVTEPKVLSTQIGVYALVTLMSMYIGLKTIGVFGMIVGPIIMVTIQTLQTIGAIPAFKKPK